MIALPAVPVVKVQPVPPPPPLFRFAAPVDATIVTLAVPLVYADPRTQIDVKPAASHFHAPVAVVLETGVPGTVGTQQLGVFTTLLSAVASNVAVPEKLSVVASMLISTMLVAELIANGTHVPDAGEPRQLEPVALIIPVCVGWLP